MMHKKVLILGGAGYLGSVLSQLLIQQGDEVTIFDAFLYGATPASPGCHVVRGDIRNIETLTPYIQNADVIINLAALSNDPAADLNNELTYQINYLANKPIAALAKKYNKRIIFASSCSTYGVANDEVATEESILAPLSLYAKTKADAELLYTTDAMDSVVLRLATLYGYSPNLRMDLVVNTMVGHAYANNQITVQGGNQWRPCISVQDAAAVFSLFVHASRIPHTIYNVGDNDQNYQISTIATLVQSHFPTTSIQTRPTNIDQRSYRVSFNRLTNDFSFKSQVSVADAVADLMAAFKRKEIIDVANLKYYRAAYLKANGVMDVITMPTYQHYEN